MRAFFATVLVILTCLAVRPAYALLDLGVRVSNLSDLTRSSWNIGDGDVTLSMDLCVYSLEVLANARYGVNVSSPGGYNLTKTGGGSLPYSVYWNDGGVGALSGVGSQLTNNVRLGNRRNASVTSYNCSAAPVGNNAKLTVRITSAAMTAALAGTYTGTITVLISPE